MQHAGLQYGQGAANSHQSPPFAHADISQTGGGNTTSSLRQFRKKDGVEKPPGQDLTTSITENSHIARVPPHNHYPARPNDYYRYHPQYPDFSTPYKETAQVKYSEIAEPPQQHVDHLVPIQKHKEKEFMDMCNISQQTHMKQNYPDNLNRQQSYPSDASVHHQYLHKEPQVHNYKPESQYQQYPQLGKYNMPSQCRKYATPPENDFLAKLQRLHPSMARSIMSDHHIRESQTYPPIDQNRIYPQNQRYYPPIQNNSYNYHTMPQYNYATSCNYKHPDYSRPNQIGSTRYPAINPHPERSISPRRNYPENLTLPMNYGNVPQKISTNYPQYNPPEYAQHYQHRRAAVPQEYYQQSGRPTQFISGHQISPETTDNRSSSSGLRHYLENWAEEEGNAEIAEANKYMYKDRIHDDTTNEPVYVINSSDISPQCLESLSLVPTENGQYIIKSGALDSSVVRIVDKDNNSTSGAAVDNERAVNLQMVDNTNKTDCMLESGGKNEESCAEKNDENVNDQETNSSPQDVNSPVNPIGDQNGEEEKEDEEESFETYDGSLTKEKMNLTISKEDNEIVTRTVEVIEKVDTEAVTVGFREINEEPFDGVIKDMPIIDEDHVKVSKDNAEEPEIEDNPLRGEEIPISSADDNSVIEDLIEEIAETKTNKRTQRIFSVDDIMNNIGNHSTNQTRRSSLQPTKDFATNLQENQTKIEETPKEDETSDQIAEETPKNEEINEEIQAISVEDTSVILELGGALVRLNVNYFNGTKVLSVLPLSESLIIDVNGNYANWDQENHSDIEEEKVDIEESVLEESVDVSEMDTSVYENEVVIGEEISASEILLDFNDNEESEEIETKTPEILTGKEETEAIPPATVVGEKKKLRRKSVDKKMVETAKIEGRRKSRSSLDKRIEVEEKTMRSNCKNVEINEESGDVEESTVIDAKLLSESTDVSSIGREESLLEISKNEETVVEDSIKLPKRKQFVEVFSDKTEDQIVFEKSKKQDFEISSKTKKSFEVVPNRKDDEIVEKLKEQEVEHSQRSRKSKKTAQIAPNQKIEENSSSKSRKLEANAKEESENFPRLKKSVIVSPSRKPEETSPVKLKKHESISKEVGLKLKKSVVVSPRKIQNETVSVEASPTRFESEIVVEKLKKLESVAKGGGEKSPKGKKTETLQKDDSSVVNKSKKNEAVEGAKSSKSKKIDTCVKDNQIKVSKNEESKSSKLKKSEIEDETKPKSKKDDETRFPKIKKLEQTIQDESKQVKVTKIETKNGEEITKQDENTIKISSFSTKAAKKLYTSDVKKIKNVQEIKTKNEEKSRQQCRKIDVKKSMSKLEETVNKIKSMREKSFKDDLKIKKTTVKKIEEISKKPEEILQETPTEIVIQLPIEEVERKKLKPVKKVTFSLGSDVKEIEETEEMRDRFRLKAEKDFENNRKRLSWEEYNNRKRKSDYHVKKTSTQTIVSSPLIEEDDDVSIEKVELSIENEINKNSSQRAPSTPPTIAISANNCWEEEVESPATPESPEIIPENPQINRNKCIIDVNEFNIKPIENSPVSSSQFSEDDSLQLYKEVVDSKLNSLNIQIPKITKTKQLHDNNEDTRISVLIQKFLSKGTLNCSELESVKKIIEYKRRLEEEGQKKKQSMYEVRGQRDYDEKDLKLHFRKVQQSAVGGDDDVDEIIPTKRKRKRFRNLYTDENSDDDDDESDSASTKIGDYSVYQRNSQGVPKLIFKRKSGLPEPFVKLERSQAVDLMAKKRKLY